MDYYEKVSPDKGILMGRKLDLTVFLFIVIIMGMLMVSHAPRDFYPTSAVVESVDYSTDTVIVRDNAGFLWGFLGCEDYQVNDEVAMIMDGKRTDMVFDDTIVIVRYHG